MNTPIYPTRRHLLTITLALLLMLALVLGACGGGSSDDTGEEAATSSEESTDSSGGAPTMPAPNFAAVEGEVDLTKVAERADDATPEPDEEPDLVLGESAYGKLCAECHGDAGGGVTDKGESIVGMALDNAAFVDLIRTGGGYGNEHIFAPIEISDDGIAALHAYVATLAGE